MRKLKQTLNVQRSTLNAQREEDSDLDVVYWTLAAAEPVQDGGGGLGVGRSPRRSPSKTAEAGWEFSVGKKMSHWIADHLWLIPAAPFAASLVILSLSNARRKSAAALNFSAQLVVGRNTRHWRESPTEPR